MAERVRITDVSPRDGLQNEPGVIPSSRKAELIRRLARTGVDEIEATSFVSAKWIPQLGDAADVLLDVASTWTHGPALSALVPNEQGMRRLLDVNREARERIGREIVSKVSVFTAASETFSKRNTNASIAETIERFRPVMALAREHSLDVRTYVSCVVACPFEGRIAPEKVGNVVEQLVKIGAHEVDLGDTIGAADARDIALLLHAVRPALVASSMSHVTLHLHDTFGRGRDCVLAALAEGVRSFDGSVAGLGGCPYASTAQQRAPGNIDTLVLVRTIHGAGYVTGVDEACLREADEYAREIISHSRIE